LSPITRRSPAIDVTSAAVASLKIDGDDCHHTLTASQRVHRLPINDPSPKQHWERSVDSHDNTLLLAVFLQKQSHDQLLVYATTAYVDTSNLCPNGQHTCAAQSAHLRRACNKLSHTATSMTLS
jgi:hypothetical protein